LKAISAVLRMMHGIKGLRRSCPMLVENSAFGIGAVTIRFLQASDFAQI
jgi:hypothetical protein